jgi:hypothetical protein
MPTRCQARRRFCQLGVRAVSGARLGDSASPRSAAGRVAGERDEEALGVPELRPLHRRPFEDLAVQAIGFVDVCGRRGDPREVDTCLGRD